MTKRFLSLALCGLLVGCAFGAGEGAAEQNDRADQILQQSIRDLEPIKGKWVGTVIVGSVPISLDVIIGSDVVNSQDRTSTGEVIQRHEPTLALSSTSSDRYPSVRFAGKFYKESGKLIMTNTAATSNGGVIRPDDPRQLELLFLGGDSMTGTMSDNRGIEIGPVVLRRSSGQNSPPTGETEEQRRNRLIREQYRRVVGDYYGQVNERDVGGFKKFGVCLQVFISEGGSQRPTLKALYVRYDTNNIDLRKTLNVNYNFDEMPQTALMTNANPQNPDSPIPGVLTIRIGGSFTDRQGRADMRKFSGTHVNLNRGLYGEIELDKIDKCPPPPKPPPSMDFPPVGDISN